MAHRPSLVHLTTAAAAVTVFAVAPAVAWADIHHVVGRGHTIEAIAHRYRVPEKAILDANPSTDAKHLHVGDVLTIPGVKTPIVSGAIAKREESGKRAEGAAGRSKSGRETITFARKAKTPGVVHLHRLATTEYFDIPIGDRRGRISPTALKTFEHALRSPGGLAHPVDPRLITLVGVVSNHFGSRKVEVISGFRPFTPAQYNPHSNHMHGKAIDFRIEGVPNEALRDFCRTLKNVGCGFYPNSVFVHLDVRDQNAFWIDYSKPGETPRYNAPNTDADEGTSDVEGAASVPPAASPTAGDTGSDTVDTQAPVVPEEPGLRGPVTSEPEREPTP